MKLYFKNSKVYDVISKVQRFLPALGAAYLALAKVWNLKFGPEINETVAIIATLLACLLEVACSQYNKEKKNESN
mgnify:CR=1 FL=1